jgi:hypothetical protein
MSEPKKRVMTESQFRGLVRGLIREYVANDETKKEPNFNKDAHPDPSARNWDLGLDEMQGPDVPPPAMEQPLEMSPDLDESEDDHSEEHGGKRVGDPRWDEHGEPTARNWDTGLD